ncbi:MAG: hypothetical protein WAT19_05320 [Ferruginibacter sp.]
MKIENHIVQYLYEAKKVTLENIGTFYLSAEIPVAEAGKEVALPPDTIRFEFDRNAVQDEGLVNYIVKQTRKIRPLASSDLESFSILARQFLNIGKPLIIEGLGTLLKSQQGGFEFIQGAYVNSKIDLQGSGPLREKVSEEISFSSPEKNKSKKSNLWLYTLIVLLLAGAASVAYYFLNKENTDTPLVQAPVVTVPDTTAAIKPADTSAAKVVTDTSLVNTADSARTAVSPAPVAGSYTFKIVIKEYANKILAEKAYQRLTNYGHKLILSPIDSVRYKLAIPFNSPMSDTLRAKDSLRIFFNSRTYVEF